MQGMMEILVRERYATLWPTSVRMGASLKEVSSMAVAETAEAGISKPLHRALAELTGEPRLDIAVHLATKDLARLRLKECYEQITQFEEDYGMSFDAFKTAWESGTIADRHSYEVEKNFWEWEAAVTNRARLEETLESLP
ncbi:MAG: hypothetical protein COZ56_20090 [Armatimonadetes bacterium CG_4_8_14_3_um_filter_58_9]|nr:MAG: hypothetical protein COZ56_20090 [Armatimonadetes bacterium CG_4_8_14_3_um_filter_58_9]PJB62944.1 MAG: hypothetical protein CO095_17540 [Armatimonadetes bacterium CG_4_9_14_3_um_filter_58_7]